MGILVFSLNVLIWIILGLLIWLSSKLQTWVNERIHHPHQIQRCKRQNLEQILKDHSSYLSNTIGSTPLVLFFSSKCKFQITRWPLWGPIALKLYLQGHKKYCLYCPPARRPSTGWRHKKPVNNLGFELCDPCGCTAIQPDSQRVAQLSNKLKWIHYCRCCCWKQARRSAGKPRSDGGSFSRDFAAAFLLAVFFF